MAASLAACTPVINCKDGDVMQGDMAICITMPVLESLRSREKKSAGDFAASPCAWVQTNPQLVQGLAWGVIRAQVWAHLVKKDKGLGRAGGQDSTEAPHMAAEGRQALLQVLPIPHVC